MATLPIQHLPFTVHVSSEHLQQWHKLAALYHENPKRFNTIINRAEEDQLELPKSVHSQLTSDYSGPNTSVSQKDDTVNTDLYQHILENCSCGNCYNRFQRPDRIPWRLVTTEHVTDPKLPQTRIYNRYVNAKHGFMTISPECDCAIKIRHDSWFRELDALPMMRGYLYNNFRTVADAQENRHKCESLSKRSDILSASVEKAQLDNKNIQHRAAMESAKTSAEVVKTKNDTIAKIYDKIEKLEKQLENSDRALRQYDFQIEHKDLPPSLALKIDQAATITASDITEYRKYAISAEQDRHMGPTIETREKPLLSFFNSMAKNARIQNNIDREQRRLERLEYNGENRSTATSASARKRIEY